MKETNNSIAKNNTEQVFTRRLDFYWKYIAVYAIAIILYALVKGTIEGRELTVMLMDPVVILLSVFIVLTALGLFIETFKKKEIIIGDDYIVFSNRFRKRKIGFDDITRIYIGRERAKYTGKFRIIKIKLKKRKRPIIIRPSSYWHEKKFIDAFVNLKHNYKNR